MSQAACTSADLVRHPTGTGVGAVADVLGACVPPALVLLDYPVAFPGSCPWIEVRGYGFGVVFTVGQHVCAIWSDCVEQLRDLGPQLFHHLSSWMPP